MGFRPSEIVRRVDAGQRRLAHRGHADREPAVQRAELLELAESGTLPGRRIGDHWRFSRPALIAWLAGS
ncbi:MAG: hypothetical protein H0V25_03155 [Solirubrobacterales bacterium]|nr:hypothetical protein [Solirubrobacterales bacterium]